MTKVQLLELRDTKPHFLVSCEDAFLQQLVRTPFHQSMIVDDLTARLTDSTPTGFSADKSQTPLLEVRLCLYSLSPNALTGPEHIEINPPGPIEHEGTTGWGNILSISGNRGLYGFYIENGYFDLQ